MTRIIEFGFEIGRSVEWTAVKASIADEHSRIVIVVPEVLARLRHCLHGPNTVFFYYRSFYDIRRNNNVLFGDETGKVVLVLPPREPEDAYSWVPFMGAIDLWLTCGAQLWLVNGPRSCDDHSWDRLNGRVRSHLLSYADMHPEFLQQVHNLVPAEPGILKASMASLTVGVVSDPHRWWTWTQAVEFYAFLRAQLKETLLLEDVRLPKSERSHPAGNPSGVRHRDTPGASAVKDGRITKRHLKRVEKIKQRSAQRLMERKLGDMELGSVERS